MADTAFEGFSNAPVDKDTGKVLDFRDVPNYVDDSPEGEIREKSQTTPSDLVEYKTEGQATNGFPAAVVPEPTEPVYVNAPQEPVEPEDEPETPEDAPEAPSDPEEPAQDADEAEGEEASGASEDETPAEPVATES